jgi:hypothetical protein
VKSATSRDRAILLVLLAAALSLAPPVVAVSAQVLVTPDRQSVRIGGLGRYEMLYGKPEFRALDNDEARPWPLRQAIRTRGIAREIPRDPTRPEESKGGIRLKLCEQQTCEALTPVDEMWDVFAAQGPFWVNQGLEVVGALDEAQTAGPPGSRPIVFLVWSVALDPGFSTKVRGPRGSSLEALVMSPSSMAGRTVTVYGTFRGANLFADLPAETRRGPADWALKDGPFSIWVTGQPPKGDGWALNPASRADCVWRLEVKGKVETQAGYVYLRAKSVILIGRARNEAADRHP